MKPRIVLSFLTTEAVRARAAAEFDAVIHTGPSDMTMAEVIEAATEHKADGIAFTNTLPLNAGSIAALPASVKVGATSSVGYDHVDVPAAKARGIMVTNTPGVLTECTADLGMMLMLDAARRGAEYDRIMRKGWGRRIGQGELLGVRVTGKRVGIVGMGRIGQAFADRCRGFGMQILYHRRNRMPVEQEKGATFFADLHDMLPHCDFLSLHAPGGAETFHMINAKALALLPKNAVFVNVSRGSLVDEDALLDALKSGHLFAAGLDVFHNEPDFDRRFADLENVVLAPHMGSASIETRDAMGFKALDNIAAVLSGKPAIDPLW